MSDVTRHDFTCFPSARVIEPDREEGKYVLHSDYANILARHNALVEAVAWERECRVADFDWWLSIRSCATEELDAQYVAARAEVDRLIADCKGEG